MFPNPANHELTLASNAVIEEIVLFDIAGSNLLKAMVKQQEVILQLQELPSGLYFLRFKLENGEWITQKVIKN